MTPPSAHRAHHPEPLHSMDDVAGDHAPHVTPAYVDAPEPTIPRTPLGHALDPHPELADRKAVDHVAMEHGLAPSPGDGHAATDATVEVTAGAARLVVPPRSGRVLRLTD